MNGLRSRFAQSNPSYITDQTTPESVISAVIAIGPEGDLSHDEIQQACDRGFKAELIGPRVLRTETTALTAATLLQSQ
ncbi:RsmE family RNA methyltransferase [Pseudomonas sp. HK3]